MNNSGLWASEGLGQLRVENFFVFFLGGPAQKKQATSLGGPAHSLQATSSQENYFYFLFDSWDIVGYNSWQEDTYER